MFQIRNSIILARLLALESWIVFSVLLAFVASEPAGAKAADAISLAFPLRCELGANCFVQNYVDHGTPDTPRDFHCAGRTYFGHSGTDIRISKLAFGRNRADILAAAPGKIIAVRDGMEDDFIRKTGGSIVAGKECGNGVVVQHEGGWQTQYCHMAKSSLVVAKAQQVRAGTVLGQVGLSGKTEFFHLHFAVRYKADVVDPFAYGAAPNSCDGGQSLWRGHKVKMLRYRDTELMDFGFSDVVPTMDAVETGDLMTHGLTGQSRAIVAFARAIGLQTGDEQELVLRGPPDYMLLAQYRVPPCPTIKLSIWSSPEKSAVRQVGRRAPTKGAIRSYAKARSSWSVPSC